MNEEETDRLFVLFGAAFLLSAGVVSFGGHIDTIRHILLEWHILAEGTDVIIPTGHDGTGIGIIPLLVLGGILVITIALAVARSRRRRFIK